MSSNENKNKLVDFRVKQWISNSSLTGDKIIIVTNNTEAYKITSNNCILIPELESNHKEAYSQIMLHELYVFWKNSFVKCMGKK